MYATTVTSVSFFLDIYLFSSSICKIIYESTYLPLQMQIVVQELPHLLICVFLQGKRPKIHGTMIFYLLLTTIKNIFGFSKEQ